LSLLCAKKGSFKNQLHKSRGTLKWNDAAFLALERSIDSFGYCNKSAEHTPRELFFFWSIVFSHQICFSQYFRYTIFSSKLVSRNSKTKKKREGIPVQGQIIKDDRLTTMTIGRTNETKAE